ncbi:MFS-type transporter SLC18B1-like isoform X2 [Atheta coriaria]
MDTSNDRVSSAATEYRTPCASLQSSGSSSGGSDTRNLTTSMFSEVITRPSSMDSSLDGRRIRSKSMSNICPNDYTPGEVRRIRERLLRTNSHLEPSAIKKFSSAQKRTLASLAIIDFMAFCSMSIMAPFFPKEAKEKGLSESVSGFVFSFYALVMFIASPIFGKIMPRLGAKFLFLSGMVTAGICNLMFGLLEYVEDYTLFTTFCLLIRGLEALGASAFSTASYVFVVKAFPNQVGSVLGILETFIGLGMSTGPALGGILYSLGGFALPFFSLGATMLIITPINVWLLPQIQEYNVDDKNTSTMTLLKLPTVIMTSAIVIVVSSTWSFLDPTLEPHLRQFDLSPEKVGLIFLLFSGLYGISSPGWGWLADKCHNHWALMISGMFSCTVGLLLLGPCPLFTFLSPSLWLNIIALSILGISVSLSLLPTFQSVLSSAIEGGCSDSLSTYSVVAGVWSCMYSLGEVLGPTLGGILQESYGFPVTSTIMASVTFFLGIMGCIFFSVKTKPKKLGYSRIPSSEDLTDSWKSGLSRHSETEKPAYYSLLDPDFRLQTNGILYGDSKKIDDYRIGYDKLNNVGYTQKGACEV